jgi:serine/alanine adding enzyme
MSMTIQRTLDEGLWRSFVERHPQGNIFHTPEMFEVFRRARGFHPDLRAALGQEGDVLALLLPVHVVLREGVLSRLTSRVIVYGSVLCAPGEAGRTALDLLLKEYGGEPKDHALYTELRNVCDQGELQPVLQAHGYSYEEHLNYLIELVRNPEEVLRHIGQHTRKHIRHALKEGAVSVEEVQERELLAAAYQLFAKSYAAAGVPLADFSLFEAALDVLKPRGMVKFLLARHGDTWIAATAELPFKSVIYGWYSGIDRKYSHVPAGELLMWHILKWGAESGYRIYDFGGAGKPGKPYPVRDFKAKFGGNLVNFGRNTKVHQPLLLRYSYLGYTIYRTIWKGSSPFQKSATPHGPFCSIF